MEPSNPLLKSNPSLVLELLDDSLHISIVPLGNVEQICDTIDALSSVDQKPERLFQMGQCEQFFLC